MILKTRLWLQAASVLVLGALVLFLSQTHCRAQQQLSQKFPRPKHKVLLLGTFHFANPGLDDFKSEHDLDVKSEQRQREISEVLDVVARFKPTQVAIEAMPDRQDELDEQFKKYLQGEFALPANEIYQLGFRLAQAQKLPRVQAIDAERRWYEPYVDPEEYAKSHGQQELVDSPWYARYQAAAEAEDKLTTNRSIGETLLALNDPERIRLSHGVYLVGTFEAGVGDEYPGVDVKTAWFNRNLRIFANLQRITRDEDERLLVIIGAGHLPLLRHCVQHSPEYELIEVSSLLESEASVVPKIDAEAIVRKHSFEIDHSNGMSGAGFDFLMKGAADAQFVLLGEPHNTNEVNRFVGQLFQELHEHYDFQHLATEQDGFITERMAAPPVRGDLKAMRQIARDHPDALHFRTDGELALLAGIGATSTATQPIWGVDRVFDAAVALEELLEVVDSDSDQPRVLGVLEEARAFAKQNSEGRYISAASANFDALLQESDFAATSRAAEILSTVRISREDLQAYQTSHDPGDPWGYVANKRREELMKSRFLQYYRYAQANTDVLPKAIVKMGHWHVVAGRNPSQISSLGNLLTELARFNGSDSLSINIQPVNNPGQHWSITDHSEYELFECVADPTKWTLVDLRPLRGHIHSGAITASETVRELVFGFDVLLLMGDTNEGEITWNQ